MAPFRRMTALAAALFCILVLAPGHGALAATYSFLASLTGSAEDPANASPGTGTASATLDTTANTLLLSVVFANLTGTSTVAHVHAPTATALSGNVGVAVTPGTLPGFPVGVTSGNYSAVVDLSLTGSYTTSFLTSGGGSAAGAQTSLLSALLDGRSYFNLHTTTYPAGEIRGFFVPAIPLPAGLWSMLAALGALTLALSARRAPQS